MTSEPTEAYVWVWLPGQTEPVVAGRIESLRQGTGFVHFNYGQSYLKRSDAIPLCLPDLPLVSGRHEPQRHLTIPGGIADAMPDYWGRQVVMYRRHGASSISRDMADLGPITYLLESSSDRIGALGFSQSSVECETTPRSGTLEELMTAAERLDSGSNLSADLADALLHGSSVGGAWPKALIHDEQSPKIAKFVTRTGRETPLKTEYVAMKLAKLAGLQVADVDLVEVLGKPVLLVDRFDREGLCRKAMISCLTLLGNSEMHNSYCTYPDFADVIRHRFADGRNDVHEVFKRIIFNILVGNTDDHAKNHSAFWDGEDLRLTPAYDIAPQLRAGGEAKQAMNIGKDGFRYANVWGATRYANDYLLSEAEATEIVEHQVAVIEDNWSQIASDARMTETEVESSFRRQFLNPYAFYKLD